MSGMVTVCIKEIVDNLSDRRTVLTSLLFGPLFGPLMFVFMANIIVDRTVDSVEDVLELPVVGAKYAPNLIRFLEQQRIAIEPGPAEPTEAVRNGEHDIVLVIDPDYPLHFRAGEPARVQLIIDRSDTHADSRVDRTWRALNSYSGRIGALRLQARGVSALANRPLLVEDIDVSTPTGRSVVILGMMTYFVLFSMLIGGMYLAIDATAGERERGSLEPLLTLPVARNQLILGKIAAACFYMFVSLAITVTLFSITLRFVPLEQLGMNAHFTATTALATAGVMTPFVLVGAGMMTVAASFTRSYKEAQTWLSVILLVPTLPIMLAAIQSLKPALPMMIVPSLSQHLLVTELIKNEPIDPIWILVSVGSTTALGALLIWVATLLYRREAILG